MGLFAIKCIIYAQHVYRRRANSGNVIVFFVHKNWKDHRDTGKTSSIVRYYTRYGIKNAGGLEMQRLMSMALAGKRHDNYGGGSDCFCNSTGIEVRNDRLH